MGTRTAQVASAVVALCAILGAVSPGAQELDSSAICQVVSDRGAIQLSPKPVIEIGSTSGAGGGDFSIVLSVAMVSDRLLAVVDNLWREVRLFDLESGAHEGTLGRRGQGPGEFSAAPTISASTSGGIWAWDPGNRRVYEFTLDGELRSSHSLSIHGPGISRANVSSYGWVVTPGGGLVSVASQFSPSRDEQSIVLIAPTNSAPVVLGQATRRAVTADPPYVLPNPFRALRQVAVWADGIAVSSPEERWVLTLYDLKGEPIREVRLPIVGPKVDGSVYEAQRDFFAEHYPEAPLRELLEGFRSVRRASAIGAIVSTTKGGLWVRRWWPESSTAPDVFDVIDSRGTWVATITVPAGCGRVVAVSDSRVITVRTDEYEVPHIQVYSVSSTRSPEGDDPGSRPLPP